MYVVDANVLLYAVNSSAPNHEAARGWLDSSLGGRDTVGFAWVVLLAFLRLATRPGLFPRPLDVTTALSITGTWVSQPRAVVLHPTARHLSVLGGLLTPAGTGGNLVSDAHLAALAVEHGAQVVSFDADFSRFPGVRWARPV